MPKIGYYYPRNACLLFVQGYRVAVRAYIRVWLCLPKLLQPYQKDTAITENNVTFTPGATRLQKNHLR